jgi:endonuclease IV
MVELGLIGFHCDRSYLKKKGATIEQHIEAAKKKLAISNLKVVQIFTGPPQNFTFSINEEGEKSLKEYINKTGMTIIAHGRYFEVPFSTQVKPGILHFMQREWKLAERSGIKGIVLHLYRYPKEIVTEKLVDLKLNPKVKIILETPAISPDKAIYDNPKALCELYTMTKKAGLNTGICIDTCHLYVSGVNLANEGVMNEFMSNLVKYIPSEDLLIHLNDSAAPLGSGKDRHASLGHGYIWGQDMGSLKIVLDYIERYKIDTILERNEGNGSLAEDYKVIRSLS